MKINKSFYNGDSWFFDLIIKDELFEDVKATKLNANKCQKCYYRDQGSCEKSRVVRKFDCKRKLDKVLFIYNILTSIIIGIITVMIFKAQNFPNIPIIANIKLQYGLFTKIGILLLCLVLLDMLCVLVEDVVPKIYDDLFYRKLKKAKNKKEKFEKIKRKEEEERKQKEEEKKQKKEAERIANTPDYKKILAAESMVNELRKLSEKYDFDSNEEKINICVEKSEAIIKELKDNIDDSSYGSVIYLFEVYLPEFYSTLNFYSRFIKSNTVTEEHKKILTETVDNTLLFLEKQRVKAIFDSESIEAQFRASADSLKHMLKEELK